MKGLAPVLAAGGTFAITALAGLGLGAFVAQRTGQPLWTVGGLFAGLGIGAYSAFRLLQRSM